MANEDGGKIYDSMFEKEICCVQLSKQQLLEFRNMLTKMKRATEQLLESSNELGLKDEFIKESVQELSNYDNHPADQGTELFERQKDLALREHANRELNEIHRALAKIDEGSYGVCEICHKEIPIERLRAHPTALTCVEHSRDQSVAIQRPVEEKLIEPPFVEFVNDDGENTSFDAEDMWQSVAKWGTSETPSDFFSNEKTDYNHMYMNADERFRSVEDIEKWLASNRYRINRDGLENEKDENEIEQ